MKLSTVSDDGQVLSLRVIGRLRYEEVLHFGDEMGAMLGSAGYARRVVLDLGAVDFIDTTGVTWLLGRHKRFREAGGKLVIHSLAPASLEVLKVLKLHHVLHLADDEPSALAMAREDHP